MSHVLHGLGQGLLIAAGMAWKTGSSLVLGFAVSALLQVLVPADRLKDWLGEDSPRAIAIAGAAGAASSSCSYASASIMRTLLRKGAALGPGLAFLVASTNLVLELGIILWVLMGWRFMVAEWIGGVILILLLALVARFAIPKWLIEEARAHREAGHDHDHGGMTLNGRSWRDRLRDPRATGAIAGAFMMEWRMLWKDLLAGFLIGGMLAAFVPDHVWQGLFLAGAPDWLRIPADVLIGPVVAMLTFVCSIGNVPLAAMLWSGGASFGGVVAFLYADLIVLPLLDTYRRYFGWRMAAAMGGSLFASMATAALIVSLLFEAGGWTPPRVTGLRAVMTDFSIDYTFWLNIVAATAASCLLFLGRRCNAPRGHDH